MAIITAALLEALRVGFKKQFNDAFTAAQAATFYRGVATIVPSTAGSETYGWLSEFPDMREWVGDRTVKDISETGYQIENKDWESTVGVKANSIKDDSLGMYTPMFQGMGRAAARHPDRLMAELMKTGNAALCYDGQNFFDTDHPVYANHDGTGAVTTVSNYDDGGGAPGPGWFLLDTSQPLRPFIFQEREKVDFTAKTDPKTSDSVFMSNKYMYGASARHNVGFALWQCAYMSRSALNGDNLDAAIAAMMEVKRDGGNPMGISPTHLYVPPALRSAAQQTVKAMFGDGGKSNTNYEVVELKVIPWLA
ncbi:Mu-like prophage major head subunit gpT family protein [Pseudaestuariivita sp.]|uniref:Mu-like prophage major head subunit gpT family protein n=1 Tax=Pseudaestuariivita sp. TaxID=2211669 RepID=UPI004059B7D8